MKNREGFAQEKAFQLGLVREAGYKHFKVNWVERILGGKIVGGKTKVGNSIGYMGNGEELILA